jgi:hypothetical protein
LHLKGIKDKVNNNNNNNNDNSNNINNFNDNNKNKSKINDNNYIYPLFKDLGCIKHALRLLDIPVITLKKAKFILIDSLIIDISLNSTMI